MRPTDITYGRLIFYCTRDLLGLWPRLLKASRLNHWIRVRTCQRIEQHPERQDVPKIKPGAAPQRHASTSSLAPPNSSQRALEYILLSTVLGFHPRLETQSIAFVFWRENLLHKYCPLTILTAPEYITKGRSAWNIHMPDSSDTEYELLPAHEHLSSASGSSSSLSLSPGPNDFGEDTTFAS